MKIKKPKKKNRAKKTVLRRIGEGFATLAILIVTAFLVLIGINVYVKLSVRKKIVSVEKAAQLEDVDCILILGASVYGTEPSPMLKDRLDRGIELYKAGVAPVIIMSGDHGGEYYDEVTVMKNYAIAQGVPSEAIFKDHAGFSTYESIYRAKEIFGVDKMVVVTQKYHLSRALYIAKKLDINAYGVAAVKTRYHNQLKRDVREFFATTKDFFGCMAGVEIDLLGSPISLDGNGDDTNIREW